MAKKFIAILLLILMAGFVFVGCGPKEFWEEGSVTAKRSNSESAEYSSEPAPRPNPRPIDPSPDSTSDPVPPPNPNQIIVWADPEDDTVKKAIENFEKKRPDIKVKIENNATVDIEALRRALSSGQAPDILRMDHVYLTGMGRSGEIVDLNKYGAKNIAPKFVDSCWDAVSHGGAVYGIPGDATTTALAYNIDMLNASGKSVSDLKTYDGLKATAKAMKVASPTKTPITFPFFGAADCWRENWPVFNFCSWLWREGGEILSSDLKTAKFNEQAGIDAMSKLVSFATEKLTQTQYMEADFYKGNVGMIEMGYWALPSLGMPHGNHIGVTTMPVLKAGVPAYSILRVFAWGVTTNKAKTSTKKSEEANQTCFDFLETFLTDDALQVSWARKNNFFPTTKTAIDNSYFTSNQVLKTFSEQMKVAKSLPGATNWFQIEGALSKAINDAVSSKNVPNALNNAANRVNELLK